VLSWKVPKEENCIWPFALVHLSYTIPSVTQSCQECMSVWEQVSALQICTSHRQKYDTLYKVKCHTCDTADACLIQMAHSIWGFYFTKRCEFGCNACSCLLLNVMQISIMWFIVDSNRDGDANKETCPTASRPVYRSLSLHQPRKRIPKVVYNGFDLLHALLRFVFGGLYFVHAIKFKICRN